MASMFASTESLSPPENLNIPHIQIPQPTECDAGAVSYATVKVYIPPPLGSPRPQRRHGSFTFPSPIPVAASASAASPNASPSASPLAPPSKCRRITTTFLDYCRVCEISLLDVTHGIYADVCKSCEDIQHRFRKGISFPACFICSSDAYHIHRNCNQAICKRCLHQYTLCPSCKVPIDKQ